MLSPSMEMRAGLDEETSGPNFLGLLNKGLRTNGGQIYLRCRIEKLLSSEGKIIGVKYKTPNNQPVKIKAPNIINASGGFQALLQLLESYLQKNS